MATALRIILGFITILIFVGIIFFTFFSQPSYLSVPEFIEQTQSGSVGPSSHYHVSRFENIYSSPEFSDAKISSSGSLDTFDISSPGKYMTSLRNTEKQYSFSGTGFIVRQEGIGEIFFDTLTTKGKTFVYTMNTPLTISLLNDETQEKYVDIHLNPHMYLEFQASRGKYLKNADRIRIATVFKLGYVGSIGADREDFVKKYISSQDEFFEETVAVMRKNDIELDRFLSDFASQEVSQIPGYDLIQRYIHLFVNDEKKVVFYQNMILGGYLKLLGTQKVEEVAVSKIQKDLRSLKELDEDAYNALLEVKEQLTLAVNANNKEEYIIPKILFSYFYREDYPVDAWYFPLYGYSLFSNYDLTGNFSYTTSKKFLQSFSIFDSFYKESDSQEGLRYDYFSFYLEKQLLYLLQGENAHQDISSIITTLENYVNISLENKDDDTTAKVSRLFVFSQILNSVDVFFRENYFLPERTQAGVLEQHTTNKMPLKDVQDLQKYINSLYEIYDKDKIHLNSKDSRDAGIIDDISVSREKVKEYFSALENYQAYKNDYDISKTNLLDLNTFSQGDGDTLTQEKIEKYLSQFVGMSFQDATITIENNIYYKISGLYISGSVFDFDVYPRSDYKLTNIFINDQKKPTQYKLGNIQDDWEDKYKKAPPEDRDQYDFSRFFFLTFFKDNNSQVEEYVNTNDVSQEDKTEVVFKKDILLGNPGEFTSVKDFLSVDYKDISLEKDGLNYKIFLKDVDFESNTEDKGGRKVINKGLLESEYVLNNIDHYFKGVSLKVYKRYNESKDGFLFNGNQINIVGKIHLTDIKDVFNKLMKNIKLYNNAYSEVTSISGVGDMRLQYTSFNDKLSIKFDSGAKKYTILLRDGKIESIYQGTKKVASGSIEIQDIPNYIK